jgi:hypothetical protein
MATIKLEKIITGGTTTYKKNGSNLESTAVAVDLLGLTNYRLKRIKTVKKNVTGISERVTETKSINYSANGTGTIGQATYSSGNPTSSNWNAGTTTKIFEEYENYYLSKAKIPVGMLDLTTEIIKSDADYYHGNNSQIAGLVSTAPKIFQGTEASFVVIESPFKYGPELYEGGCGNATEKNRGNSARYAPYAGYNYYRTGKKIMGAPQGYSYGPTYKAGNINCRQQWVHRDGSCSNWTGTVWTLPDLESISRCVFSGNWYNNQFFTRGPTQGFNFWTNSATNKQGIQKAMDFVEGQTKIDLSNLYSPSNTTGFRARIIPWVSGTDGRLRRRWLLSSDGKLATYYAQPNTRGHSYGSGYWSNYHCINTSTPTTLTV